MPKMRSRKSKLAPYASLLGDLSDREIAERAYRRRRGIPARWRGESETELKDGADGRAQRSKAGQVARTSAAASGAGATGRPKKKVRKLRGRTSKLAVFEDLLGEVPDRELAEKAGVTVQNVRAYRVRRGIASWRDKGRRAQIPTPALRRGANKPTAQTSPKHVDGAGSPPRGRLASGSAELLAFRVLVERNRETESFVVVAPSLSEAARLAEDRLAQRWPGGLVVELGRLGRVL